MPPTELPIVDLDQLQATLPDSHPAIRFGQHSIDAHLQAYREHGPIFQIETRGEPVVVIGGEEANADTWGNPDDWSYHDAMKGFRDELGPLHLTQLDGERHKRKRILLNDAFSMRAILGLIPRMDAVITRGLQALSASDTVELHHALMSLLTRVQSSSTVPCDLTPEMVQQLVRFEEEFISAVLMEEPERSLYFARPDYQLLKDSTLAFLAELVADRRANPEQGDLLCALMKAHEGRDFEPLNDEELLDDTYLLLIAGHGNTAKLICRVLHHAYAEPAVLAGLRAELDGFDGASLQGMDDFPILKNCILECERLYPAAPILPRVAAREVDLLGHRLGSGQKVMHLHTLTHYLNELYEEPFAFKPQRWDSLNVRRERRNAHGTFGGGRHTCLGMNFARLHVPLTVGNVIARYDMRIESEVGCGPVVPGYEGSPETLEFFIGLSPRA
ncbi:MAG: cytochrome P450 [Opitutales bacterium]